MTNDFEHDITTRLVALAERAPAHAVSRQDVTRRLHRRSVKRRVALGAGAAAFAGATVTTFALRANHDRHVTAGAGTGDQREFGLASTAGERVPRLALADPGARVTTVLKPLVSPLSGAGTHEQLWSDGDELRGRRLVVSLDTPAADTMNAAATDVTVQGQPARLTTVSTPGPGNGVRSSLAGTLSYGRTFLVQSYGVSDADLLAFAESLRPGSGTGSATTVAGSAAGVAADAPAGMALVREDTITAEPSLESQYAGTAIKQITLECAGIACYESYRSDRMNYAHVAAATVHRQPAIVASDDGREWRVVFNERGLWTYEVTVDAASAAGAAQLVNDQVVDVTDAAWDALITRATNVIDPTASTPVPASTPTKGSGPVSATAVATPGNVSVEASTPAAASTSVVAKP